MINFWLIIGLIFGFYFFVIFSFYLGWKRIPELKALPDKLEVFISVVVAARNEESNIGLLLKHLISQNYNPDYFEIIVVNDHSEDGTAEAIRNFSNRYPNIIISQLPIEKKGKKEALEYGINIARGELIVTTDADCVMETTWLQSHASLYTIYKPKLIVGPVFYTDHNNSFLSKFQQLEFMSLVASGAGALGLQLPISCNGANLSFPKETYISCKSELKKEIASGDDIFLMLSAKRKWKKSIHFLKSKEAIVYTKPQADFRSFIMQRRRWGSKSRYYNDFFILFVASIVGAFNFALLILLIGSFFILKLTLFFCILLIIKIFIDLPLMYSYSNFFGKARIMQYFWLAQLLYPFYMVFMIVYANLGVYQWKNRKYNLK